MMKKTIGKAWLAMACLISPAVFASSYPIPAESDALVGQVQSITTALNDTGTTIAERYDLGYNAIENANPQLDLTHLLPSGQPVTIVSQHIIPDLPREGIIVNLPEMRLYYFPAGSTHVYTYPIGIGKIGKTIPITRTAVTRKKENPNWIAPADIREFDLKTQGLIVPQVVPPGPDNPLGPYAIYMQIPTYLIHSTIFPESIGKRASFGCIRMYQSDIKVFFPSIEKGIPVAIVNTPVKFGWEGKHLYMEAHPSLEEHSANYDASLPGVVHAIQEKANGQPVLVDWQQVAYVASERDGVPHEIAVKVSVPST